MWRIKTQLHWLSLLAVTTAWSDQNSVDFARDVRSILSEKCFQCHGPDAAARQADLRLDQQDDVFADRDGYAVVVPGDPHASELITRIESADDDVRMPPTDTGLSLSDGEKKILRRWVAEGAGWQQHWSYQPIARVQVPVQAGSDWCRNEIDHFILRRLVQNDLQPSPEANRETLIRRLALDLVGLPPAPAQTMALLNDQLPDAYERLVDQLLADPRYGEHMSVSWLDAARYADTDGYQNDGPRSMWRWRDWVIKALNHNMPFDQFTIEQLAGDWIPGATLEQIMATGFNRNHRYNSESGLVLEEFLLENAVDRVDTVSTVWMGVTMGCARCHDHKYDPFSQREYYQLVAYFDNVSESGRAVKFGNSEPWVVAPTEAQSHELVMLEDKIAAAKQAIINAEHEIKVAQKQFEAEPRISDPAPPVVARGLTHHYLAEGDPAELDGKTTQVIAKQGPAVKCQQRSSVAFWIKPRSDNGVVISAQPDSKNNLNRPGLSVELADRRLRYHIITRWVAGVGAVETKQPLPLDRWTHVALTNDGSQSARGMQIFVDGRRAETTVLYNTNSNVSGDAKYPVRIGGDIHRASFNGLLKDLRFYNRTLSRDESQLLAADELPADLLEIPARNRSFSQQRLLRAWFLEHHAPQHLQSLADDLFTARVTHQSFYDRLPTVMVMDHETERPTHVRRRGVYNEYGDKVSPGTPSLLPPSAASNRLEFARWLVSGEHPLTARVAVNRIWQQFFGRGLVDTPEDFGVQGAPPSHPELLDWLAGEFQASGWDIKRLQSLIVSSATYRQQSNAARDAVRQDPANRWLSRAPRQRLPAHVIRDQALSVAGLLVSEIGGPSVSPYQPADLWKSLSNMQYKQSTGANLYRRSLYTIWKRTLVPPTMSILDAADRENCSVRPKRTNTPLQALTLLNETAFVEAARGLAIRMLAEPSDPVAFGFQLVTGRRPNQSEQAILQSALDEYRDAYRDSPESAKQLLSVGESSIPRGTDLQELATYTVFANLLLNLDEAITRE